MLTIIKHSSIDEKYYVFFFIIEIIFLLLNIRLFTQLSIDVIISVIIFVCYWIFIMVGVVCLSYYTTLLFRKVGLACLKNKYTQCLYIYIILFLRTYNIVNNIETIY